MIIMQHLAPSERAYCLVCHTPRSRIQSVFSTSPLLRCFVVYVSPQRFGVRYKASAVHVWIEANQMDVGKFEPEDFRFHPPVSLHSHTHTHTHASYNVVILTLCCWHLPKSRTVAHSVSPNQLMLQASGWSVPILRCPQRCCWRFRASALWSCASGRFERSTLFLVRLLDPWEWEVYVTSKRRYALNLRRRVTSQNTWNPKRTGWCSESDNKAAACLTYTVHTVRSQCLGYIRHYVRDNNKQQEILTFRHRAFSI
jgi:hypothetical protein